MDDATLYVRRWPINQSWIINGGGAGLDSPAPLSLNAARDDFSRVPCVSNMIHTRSFPAAHQPSHVIMTAGSGSNVNDVNNIAFRYSVNNAAKPKPKPKPVFLNSTPSTCNVELVGMALNSKWQKSGEDMILNGPVLKKHKNSSAENAEIRSVDKDLLFDPDMLLINILKMGHQLRLAPDTQHKSSDPVTSRLPASASISFPEAAPLGVLPRPDGVLPVVSPMCAAGELGMVPMKPGDPRQVLHKTTLQRRESLGCEQLRKNGPSTASIQKENLIAVKEEGQAERKPMLCHSIPPPDITLEFTDCLRNISDLISVSQPITTSLTVPQDVPAKPAQVKLDRVNAKAENFTSVDQQTGTSSAPQSGVAVRKQNSCVDVENLSEGSDHKQKPAIQRERTGRMEEQKKLFAARKLSLVLDLDHTLLNSAKFIEVGRFHDEILREKEKQDREKPHRHLFRFPHMGMWTKLRPGIWNFLKKASELYELHLYTMGNKLYATEMAKILDPKGVLFSGRVLSRGDDGDPLDSDESVPKIKDLKGVLGTESSIVIIDDSVRVWPHNKLNLIVVERYTYFPCSRRQFGLPGPSLLEIDRDERAKDGTLASYLAVIKRIHQKIFSLESLEDVDVRFILALEQTKVLAGCCILFSRVFPVAEVNPHLHPLWQTAEQYGAVCVAKIDDRVTHVVGHSLGTSKVNWAFNTGRYVVRPDWVEASALLYRRANEHDFAIKS